MGVVKRVHNFVRFPYPLQGGEFPCKARSSNRIKILTPRYGFMVDQDGPWLVERLPTSLIEPQTKINIIIRNGKIAFIETTNCEKTLSINNQARARDR
jgi:hypothetical protein